MNPADLTPDMRDRLVRLRERGALTPEAARNVDDYLRRVAVIAAGKKDPGPTKDPAPVIGWGMP